MHREGVVVPAKEEGLDPFKRALFAWLALIPLGAVVANGIILWNLRQQRVQPTTITKSKRESFYTIPASAMVASTFTFFAAPGIFSLVYLFNIDKEISGNIGNFFLLSINALRCPLVTALTFSDKLRVDQESREKRQERVREWAIKERIEMKRLKNTSPAT